jgi:hypothetical protein
MKTATPALTFKALEAAGWVLETLSKTSYMLANAYHLKRGEVMLFVEKTKTHSWRATVSSGRDYPYHFETFGVYYNHTREEALSELASRNVGLCKGMLTGITRAESIVEFASWALAPEASIVSDPLTHQVKSFVLGFNACNRDKRTEKADYASAAYYLCGFTNAAYEKFGPPLMEVLTNTQGFGIPESLIPTLVEIISRPKVAA